MGAKPIARSKNLFRGRLRVGRKPLELLILVRIQAPEPFDSKTRPKAGFSTQGKPLIESEVLSGPEFVDSLPRELKKNP